MTRELKQSLFDRAANYLNLRKHTDPYLGVPEGKTPGQQFKELYDRSLDTTPMPYGSRFANSFASGVGGDVLDMATDPWAYIGAGVIKKAAPFIGKIPVGKTNVGKLLTTPITESFFSDISRMRRGLKPNLGPTEADLIRSGRKSIAQARSERGSPVKLLTDQRGSIEIMPEDMPIEAPYNLGAGFGSTVLREMIESGQGRFNPDQIASRLGQMSKDERDMLGFEGWQPDKPLSLAEVAQEAMKKKMMLQEITKSGSGLPSEDEAFNMTAEDHRGRGTKFQNYQLPGGKNYSETLLTLPPKRELPEGFTLEERPNNGTKSRWIVNGPGSLATNQYGSGETAEQAMDSFLRHGHTGAFKSTHWDEPNVIAHYRMNEREIGGNPANFLEEVQSDWHQQGREKGYTPDIKLLSEKESPRSLFKDLLAQVESSGDGVEKISEFAFVYNSPKSGKRVLAIENAPYGEDGPLRLRQYDVSGKSITKDNIETILERGEIPDAPFKKTWHELAMKHALAKSARSGKESVGWTTGEQQVERYDLSKQVEEVGYQKRQDGKYHLVIFPKGQADISKLLTEEELPDFIGKDLAKKIVNGEGELSKNGSFKTFKGIDLKVGGEGMKAFYDQMLPQAMNKYTKKWGGRVGEKEITGTADIDLAGDPTTPNRVNVHTLDITPSMKDAFMKRMKK